VTGLGDAELQAELGAAKGREEWLEARLREAMVERDRYRGWFERLFAAAWRSEEPALRSELERVQAERTAPARNARSRAADYRAIRAQSLKAEGLSAAAIGLRMAREDGRPDHPYDASQVRRWFRRRVQT
jgi:hypothetical protein